MAVLPVANDSSLQVLLRDALVSTGHVCDAAILRKKDGAMMALTPGFKVTFFIAISQEDF